MPYKRISRAALVAAVLGAMPSIGMAQSATWTSATNASFSVGPWTPAVPGYGGGISVGLQFNNPTATGYTATNDLGPPFLLQRLNLNSTGGGTISIANAPGNLLRFVDLNSTISLSTSGPGQINGRVDFQTNGMNLNSPGAGTLHFNAPITGAGTVLIGAGNFRFNTTSPYAASTLITNPNVISLAADNALGTGTLIVTAATFRNPDPGVTLPSIVTLRNNTQLAGALTYNAPALADLLLAGSVSGAGSIAVSGAGALRLTGSNSYTGGTHFIGQTGVFDAKLITTSPNIGTGSANFVSGGGELIFTGAAGSTGPVNVQSTATGFIAPGTDVTTVSAGNLSGSGTLILGLLSNTGTINLAGSGNSNTGPISFFSGVTAFDTAAQMGNAATLLFDGGTLYPNGNLWSNTKPIVVSDYTAINVGELNTATLQTNAISVNPAPINDAIIKTGGGTLQLRVNSGARIVVNNGTLAINGGSITYALANGAPLKINPGGAVILTSLNALPDAGTVALAGGYLQINNAETAGTLELTANTRSLLGVTGNATFSALSRPTGAAILFSSDSLASGSRIRFNTAPAGSLLTGGGGAVGTATVSILAGAMAMNGVTTPFNGTLAFTAYDAATGVRQLTAGEYANFITSGSSVLNNASFTTTQTINAPTVINSLTLNSGATVSGTGSLGINSGMILANSTGLINVATLSLGDGLIAGNVAANISIFSNIVGTSLMTAGNVLLYGSNSYSGPTIITSGILSSQANEVIPNGSTVNLNSGARWNLGDRTETIGALTQQNITDNRGTYGTLSLGVGAGGTLIVGSGNLSSSFAGNFIGNGQVQKIGTGTLTLSGSSSITGGINVTQGIVRAEARTVAASPDGIAVNFAGAARANVSGDAVLGGGTLALSAGSGNSAEIRIGRGITSLSRNILVSGTGTNIFSSDTDPNRGTPAASNFNMSGTIQINSALQLTLSGGTISGGMAGNSSITVSSLFPGAPLPIVTISGSKTYTGTTTIKSGSLYLASSAQASGIGAVGNGSSPIALGQADTNTYAEISAIAPLVNIARPIVTTVGQPGFTLALSGRTPGFGASYSGTIALAALPLRVFSAPLLSNSTVSGLSINGPIEGVGSLLVGGGVDRSDVSLSSPSSTFSGGTTLTDGTLSLYASSTPLTGTPTSGPLGTGTLIVAGSNGPVTINAFQGNRTIANPVTLLSDMIKGGDVRLTFNGNMDLGGAERTIAVNGATFTINGVISNGSISNGSINKDGAGRLVLGASNSYTGPTSIFAGTLEFGASQNLSSLNIGAGALAMVSAGGDKTLRMSGLNIAPGGTLDLTDEDAILDYVGTSPLARIQSQISSAYGSGSWNGTGVTSGTAGATVGSAQPTAIGFAEALAVGAGTFNGQSVGPMSILLKYTLSGDANLDGLVNALDFNALASNFGIPSRTWVQGDFNYDGQINTADFDRLAGNFNSALASSPVLGTVVPEPASLAVILLVAPLSRRTRRACPQSH